MLRKSSPSVVIALSAGIALSCAEPEPTAVPGEIAPRPRISPVHALADLPAAEPALAAHRDGLAGVAALKLGKLLQDSSFPDGQRDAIRALRIENLVRAGRHQEALAALGDLDLPFWRAAALVGCGEDEEALPLFQRCADDPTHPQATQAALSAASIETSKDRFTEATAILEAALAHGGAGREQLAIAAAEIHLRTGSPSLAKKVLSPASDFTSLAAVVIRADAALRSDAPDAAIPPLESVLSKEKPVPRPLLTRATFLICDAYAALGNAPAAHSRLKSFAETISDPDAILQAAGRLAELGAFDSSEGARLLAAWEASSNAPLAAVSRFHQARQAFASGDATSAKALLQPLASAPSEIGLRAKLLLVRILVADNDRPGAEAEISKLRSGTTSPSVRARIQFVEARADYLAGDFIKATKSFAEVAEVSVTADLAAFNAALAALKAGDEEEFEAKIALLPEVAGDRSRGVLQLERALVLSEYARILSRDAERPEDSDAAASAYAKATKALEDFLRTEPKHARAAEAQLALASIYLIAYTPPKCQPARDAVTAAEAADPSPSLREKLAYLRFWIEEVDREDPDLAVKLAESYLGDAEWSRSARAPEVRMRQAEIYFRNGDYVDARRKFEQLVADYPDSEYADQALFFAGRAAMLTRTPEGAEKALELWQALVEKSSPLALSARRHQAQIRLRQGEWKEAIGLIDAIVAATPPPETALLVSSLLIKGEALAVLAGKGEIDSKEATAIFEQARNTEGATAAAIHEAYFREGQVYAAAGNRVAALNCYHEVVDGAAGRVEPGSPPDYIWFYHAGFEAIRLLQAEGEGQNIDGAIAIANQLASTPGPRAAEAYEVSELLKLVHLRWD